MNYIELRRELKDYPIFKLEDILKWFSKEDRRSLIVQLSNWTKKGYLERLKRGVYKFTDFQIEDVFVLANFFVPSYISCETALNYYGIIPDVPFAVTSVTSFKTSTFKTENYGLFIYRHIKPDLFFGYRNISSFLSYSYQIAKPEKALFDFLYLQSFKRDFNPDTYLKEMRLDIEKGFEWGDIIKWQKLVSKKNKIFHLAIENLFNEYKHV